MTPPLDPDPRYVAGPEPIIREPSRWPLVVAVLIIVAAVVFVAQVAASRAGQGSTSAVRVPPAVEDIPAQPGTLQRRSSEESTAARVDAGGSEVTRFEFPGRLGSVPRTPSETVGGSSTAPGGVLPDTSTSVTGTASWFCGGGSACTRGYPPGQLAAAAGPALRVGDWRGRIVKVCSSGRCVKVQLVDWCFCGSGRVIDLYRSAFSRLANPSRGLLRVSITWGGSTVVLPPTDTR